MTRCFPAAASAVLVLATLSACGGGTSSEPNTPPAATAPVKNPVNPETAGTISGRVTFDGSAPAPQPIKTSSDPNCAATGVSLVSESLVVGNDKGLQNVFVYVKDGLGNLVFPVPATPVVLDQEGCHYVPHVFGVQVGQPVEIRNSDATLHNIHAIAHTNREFNMGQPTKGMTSTHIFTSKEVLLPFKCDVHGWMNAYVGVVDHPFFSVTDNSGRFSLKGLPPGTYTIEAIHEKLGAKTQSVTVGEKESKEVAFAFAQPAATN